MAKKAKLKKAYSDKSFYLQNGELARDLLQLAEEIDAASKDVFEHHVNDERNDFAAWVEAVFKEKKLAEKLLGIEDKDRYVIELLKFVANQLK